MQRAFAAFQRSCLCFHSEAHFPRSVARSSVFIIRTDKEIFIVDWGTTSFKKGKCSSADHAPYPRVLSPTHWKLRQDRMAERCPLVEKHILRGGNWFNYWSRRSALPGAFHRHIIFLRFISSSVCLRNISSALSRVFVSESGFGWKKSKPCFSLLYLACQCVGCQLCILFRLEGQKNLKIFPSFLLRLDIVMTYCRYTFEWFVQ